MLQETEPPQKIINEGIKNIEAGASPSHIKQGLNLGLQTIKETILKNSLKVSTNDDIKNIATISSGDQTVGNLIAEAISKVGTNGIISLEEGKQTQTMLKLVEGLEFDRGFVSPYMATDQEKLIAELVNAKVLVCADKINSVNQVLPILEVCNQHSIPLLIIAEDFEQEVITMLVVNKLRGNLNVVAVKAPSFADKRRQILEDICAISGATLFSNTLNNYLSDTKIEDLGEVSKIVVSANQTTLIDPKINKEQTSN